MAGAVFSALVVPASAVAQNMAQQEEPEVSIVDILSSQNAILNFEIPDDILDNLNMNPGALKKPGSQEKGVRKSGIKKSQGFRIQVFSDGRNPSTLQSRAKARGNAIIAKFPKYRGQVYSFSSAPNWYTRVGNFTTQQAANDALAELRRAFPSFASEMRIVKSPISVLR